MARERNKKARDAVDSEASKQSRSETKTPKPLKPDPKIVKKSPNLSSGRNPEKADNVDKSKEKKKKESDNAQVKDQRDAGNKEKIDGMIFMCNSKTKSDCFRYMVMGLPQSKKEMVISIKPGLKLFLYDFNTKLLHGIYKATSAGGMKLEPAAFSGSYPAQVRFKVHIDCLPLSEGTFRKAVMGNSGGEKIKFNTELTAQEVRKLTSLFQALPVLKSNVNTTVHGPQPVQIPFIPLRPIIPATEAPLHPPHAEILGGGQKETLPIQREDVTLDPLSFTEKEYRMFGLRRHTRPAPLPMSDPSIASDPSHGNRNPYNPYASLARAAYPSKTDAENDRSRRRMTESEYKRPTSEQLATQPVYYHSYAYGVPKSDAGYPSKTDAENDHSQRRMTESEYKRLTTEQLATQPAYYYSYAYGVPKSEAAYPSNTDVENDHSQRRMTESEYKRPTAEQLATQPAYYHNYAYGVSKSEAGYRVREAEVGTLHSTHAATALPDYNRSHQQLRDTGDYGFLPVSSRYSFAGPS